jgi:putative ABC transport system permease protein
MELGVLDVFVAGLLLAAASGVASVARVRADSSLFWAALRMVAQLSCAGVVLRWIMTNTVMGVVLGICLIMTVSAGVAAVRRVNPRWQYSQREGILSVAIGGWFVLAMSLFAVFRSDPWFDSRFAIPLLGMILGNAMTAVALAIDRYGADVDRTHDWVMAALAMGATNAEATRHCVREAVRAGMTPVTNQMAVAGIVTLPGMMTGQILAGVNPESAVRYQIAMMLLIATSTLLSIVVAIRFAVTSVLDRNSRFHSLKTQLLVEQV